MAGPKVDKIYGAIDIGSSKISALIAGRTEDGGIAVLGTGQRESRGVKRGYVADVEACEMAVRSAVEQAERIAGVNIDRAWVGFSAGGLESSLASVETDIGGHRVEQDDIDDLLAKGRANLDPHGKIVMHAQPALYWIDGLDGIKNPKGLHADYLGVDIHVVLADASPVRNIEMAVCAAHLGVEAIVAAPVASGLSCLNEEERELGVALVEIGASVTNISLYAGGMLLGLHTLPYGGADITDDIASAFGLRRLQAERLKCFYGSAQSSPRDNHDVIELDKDAAHSEGEPPRITRAQLISVIRQRLDHLTGEIKNALKAMGFMDPLGRQVVLTGGTADLKGIADYVQSALGRPVRVGRPSGLAALPEAHCGPAFATLTGLILHAAANPVDLRNLYMEPQSTTRVAGASSWSRLVRILKTSF